MLGPVSYRFIRTSLHTGYLPWQKLTQKIVILTCACRPTVAGLLFIFCGQQGRRQESYLSVPRLYKERGQKLGYKMSHLVFNDI